MTEDLMRYPFMHTFRISLVILSSYFFFLNMCSCWLEEVYLRYLFRLCVGCFFICMMSCYLRKWLSFVTLCLLRRLALICFSQKFAKWGDCWVFVLAALLIKQIPMFVMLDTIFQHVLDDVLDDVSTCPFCSCVTFLHGCGLKKCMCGISVWSGTQLKQLENLEKWERERERERRERERV